MGSKPTGDSMNGLTAVNVKHLTESINRSIGIYKASGRKEAAGALEDLLYAINEMRRYNTTHPSRPDRVGDECWCGTWERGKGWAWHRGILRAWVPGDCPAVVEDVEAKKVECYSMISFSEEAPS
jgi:hypothetical protein